MITAKTAFVLFAVLAGTALWTLKGKPLAFALIIVGAMAAKTYVEELKKKL